MLGSVLPFDEETADRVSDYCEQKSTPITDILDKHWEWTRTHFSDADKMSSRLQGAWMIFTARDRKPKRGNVSSLLYHLYWSRPLIASNATQSWKLVVSVATVLLPGTKAPRIPKLRLSRWNLVQR
jgi:hypothetical protein